jgi:hypothetical protein
MGPPSRSALGAVAGRLAGATGWSRSAAGWAKLSPPFLGSGTAFGEPRVAPRVRDARREAGEAAPAWSAAQVKGPGAQGYWGDAERRPPCYVTGGSAPATSHARAPRWSCSRAQQARDQARRIYACTPSVEHALERSRGAGGRAWSACPTSGSEGAGGRGPPGGASRSRRPPSRRSTAEHLAGYKVPKRFVRVDDLRARHRQSPEGALLASSTECLRGSGDR